MNAIFIIITLKIDLALFLAQSYPGLDWCMKGLQQWNMALLLYNGFWWHAQCASSSHFKSIRAISSNVGGLLSGPGRYIQSDGDGQNGKEGERRRWVGKG